MLAPPPQRPESLRFRLAMHGLEGLGMLRPFQTSDLGFVALLAFAVALGIRTAAAPPPANAIAGLRALRLVQTSTPPDFFALTCLLLLRGRLSRFQTSVNIRP